jgi:hypothetical protein
MGFNTTVFILNDMVEDIRRNPQLFVEQLCDAIRSCPSQKTTILGQTTVMPTAHADVDRLYYTHGNAMSEIYIPYSEDVKRQYLGLKDYYIEVLKNCRWKVKEMARFLRTGIGY